MQRLVRRGRDPADEEGGGLGITTFRLVGIGGDERVGGANLGGYRKRAYAVGACAEASPAWPGSCEVSLCTPYTRTVHTHVRMYDYVQYVCT